MKPTHEELEHIACEMSQQDWNDLRFAGVYYEAFVEGGKWFMRSYEQLEQERNELAAQVELLRAEFPLFDDDGLCEHEHHCEFTLLQERKRLHKILSETPPAALTALKAEWQADILLSTSIQIAAGKPEATPIQIAIALLEESERIRQSAGG